MSLLSDLEKARRSSSVPLHEFLLNIDSQKYTIHAFFEGKTDESFYGTIIRRYNKKYNYKSYKCGNKKSVYETFNKLRTRYIKDQVLLFFVDKDLDDIIPILYEINDSIYVTDYYSIENYLVDKSILEQVCSEIFKEDSGCNHVVKFSEKFELSCKLFYDFMIIVMAWILYHRRMGSRLQVNNININTFFVVNHNLDLNVKISYDEIIDNLDKMAVVKTDKESWEKSKDILLKELLKFNPKNVIRGKFEVDFFIQFINACKKAIDYIHDKNVKVSAPINKDNIIDILGPRVSYPFSLVRFIENHIGI